jgi:hypothetical protein
MTHGRTSPSVIHNEKAQPMMETRRATGSEKDNMGVRADWFGRFFTIGSSQETSNENHFHHWLSKNQW